jgi:hypothetical protein
LTILPDNFETASRSQLFYSNESLWVAYGLAEAGIKETPLELDESSRISLIMESAEPLRFAPILFLAYKVVTQQPEIVSICIDVIRKYIYRPSHGECEIHVVVDEQPNSRCTMISYKGTADGLAQLSEAIREVVKPK